MQDDIQNWPRVVIDCASPVPSHRQMEFLDFIPNRREGRVRCENHTRRQKCLTQFAGLLRRDVDRYGFISYLDVQLWGSIRTDDDAELSSWLFNAMVHDSPPPNT